MPTGTSRWGAVAWGASAPAPGSGATLDVANAVADVIYRLGFANASELNSASWVTSVELYQWADDAAKRLASEAGAFVTWDASAAVTAATAVYSLPASHVFTLACGLVYASGSIQFLRMTAVRDLWALDGNWETTTGSPARASFDAGAAGTITLYPIPVANATLAQVVQEYPATIAAGSSAIALPTVLQDFFAYALLAGARGKESSQADPAMANHYGERVKLYARIAEHLFGAGQ